jgi:dCMP deaminase
MEHSSKIKFYLSIAVAVSKASYCERSKVGAIIVKDDNIISFGYNGTPSGFNNCCEIDGVTIKEVLHAESNAITKCAKSFYSSNDSIMFCTLSPCFDCAKLIIQSGIRSVYFIEKYRDDSGLKLLKQLNVYTEQVSIS